MGKEIIINAEKNYTRIAIVENGELGELHFENPENERTIGNIYLGRIRRVMPSIQAAFVDIGQEQDAFLHFSDLSDNLPELLSFIAQDNPRVEDAKLASDDNNGNSSKGGRKSHRSRNMEKHLKDGQRILVKIVKEPISDKGSRISTNISLAGRFLVLVPLSNFTAVSKKIGSQKERRRLRALARSLLPENYGVIVRTVAQGRDAKSLDTDMNLLLERWRRIEKNLQGRPNPPKLVHEDVNMASSIMRDLFTQDFDRVLIDHPRLYGKIKGYVQAVAPKMVDSVELHKGDQHVFHAMKVAQDIEEVFDSRVELPSGGYLFIEQTEAMHVVDVNSGRSGRGMSQEENSLKVNLEAARAIAKQIRLRDLGGIIVVDFIDMRSRKNRKKVYDLLQKEFKRDRAVTKVLPMSDFGVMEITRQRLRPSLTTTFSDSGVNGEAKKETEKKSAPKPKPEAQEARSENRESGEERRQAEERRPQHRAARERAAEPEKTPEELVREIEAWIAAYKKESNRRSVALRVHPFTAAYLNRRVPTHPTRWFMKHLVRVRMEADEQLPPLGYRFQDPSSGEDITDTVELQRDSQRAA